MVVVFKTDSFRSNTVMMVKFLRRCKCYISVKIVKVDCLYPYLIVSVFKTDSFRANTVMMVKFLRQYKYVLY